MSEAQRILALARRARARGERLCLATVVQVEGSSYRKPGARMLVTSGGERVGTISGGCLETEVSRKAWWLTADGARVERYASFTDEDGGAPYGLGCGGTVSLLLEQGEPVEAVLAALERVLSARQPEVVVTALGLGDVRPVSGLANGMQEDAAGGFPGDIHGLAGTFAVLAPARADGLSVSPRAAAPAGWTRQPALEVMYLRETWPHAGLSELHAEAGGAAARGGLGTPGLGADGLGAGGFGAGAAGWAALEQAAQTVFETRESRLLTGDLRVYPVGRTDTGRTESEDRMETDRAAWFIEYLAPPPAVTLFGAGDDAQPIAELAHTLGWRVSVVDGRAHLARRERFPQACEVRVLDYADPSLRTACGMANNGGSSNGSAHAAASHPALPDGAAAGGLAGSTGLRADEIAVILTHSYEQDRALLQALLPRKLLYLGILGPRHRTERLLAEVVPSLGLSIEEGFARLHSPVGLDLGGGDPAAVALSIVAEIQAVLHGRSVEVTRSRVPARGAEPDGDPAAGAGANVGADPDGEAVPGNFATAGAKDHLA